MSLHGAKNDSSWYKSKRHPMRELLVWQGTKLILQHLERCEYPAAPSDSFGSTRTEHLQGMKSVLPACPRCFHGQLLKREQLPGEWAQVCSQCGFRNELSLPDTSDVKPKRRKTA